MDSALNPQLFVASNPGGRHGIQTNSIFTTGRHCCGNHLGQLRPTRTLETTTSSSSGSCLTDGREDYGRLLAPGGGGKKGRQPKRWKMWWRSTVQRWMPFIRVVLQRSFCQQQTVRLLNPPVRRFNGCVAGPRSVRYCGPSLQLQFPAAATLSCLNQATCPRRLHPKCTG